MSQPRKYRVYVRSNLWASWRDWLIDDPEAHIYEAIVAGLIPQLDSTARPDEYPGVLFQGWHKDMYSICIRELR